MALLETWREQAYNAQTDKKQMQAFWDEYFKKEQAIYEQLLDDPDTEVKGTVKELAEKYGYEVVIHICRGNYKNVHNVPTDVIAKMRERFEY